MPSPFYNTSGAVGLRKLLGTSKVHDIGVGFQALGDDIEELLALGIYNEVKHTANCTASAGEFLLMEAAGAVKVLLPVGSRNIMVGLHNTGSANVKIEPQAGEIYSAGGEERASVELAPSNYLFLLSVPARGWFVFAGEAVKSGVVRQERGTALSYQSWGLVSEAGTIEGGTADFTVSKIGTGEYEIKWTKEKGSALYAPNAQQLGAVGPALVSNVTTKGFKVRTSSLNASSEFVLTNHPFSFVALASS